VIAKSGNPKDFLEENMSVDKQHCRQARMLLLVQLKHAQEMTTPAHSDDDVTDWVHFWKSRSLSTQEWGDIC